MGPVGRACIPSSSLQGPAKRWFPGCVNATGKVKADVVSNSRLGAGQTVKRQMVTYRIMAFGEEMAGFGQVVKGLGNLSPLVTILRRTQASGKSMDLDFST